MVKSESLSYRENLGPSPGTRPRENSNHLNHCHWWLQHRPVRSRKTSIIKELTPSLVIGLGSECDQNPCLDDLDFLSYQKNPGPASGLNSVGSQLDFCFFHSMKSTSESLFYHFHVQLLSDTQGSFQGTCRPTDSGYY